MTIFPRNVYSTMRMGNAMIARISTFSTDIAPRSSRCRAVSCSFSFFTISERSVTPPPPWPRLTLYRHIRRHSGRATYPSGNRISNQIRCDHVTIIPSSMGDRAAIGNTTRASTNMYSVDDPPRMRRKPLLPRALPRGASLRPVIRCHAIIASPLNGLPRLSEPASF